MRMRAGGGVTFGPKRSSLESPPIGRQMMAFGLSTFGFRLLISHLCFTASIVFVFSKKRTVFIKLNSFLSLNRPWGNTLGNNFN